MADPDVLRNPEDTWLAVFAGVTLASAMLAAWLLGALLPRIQHMMPMPGCQPGPVQPYPQVPPGTDELRREPPGRDL